MGSIKAYKGVGGSCEWFLIEIDVNRVEEHILHHNRNKYFVVFL